VGRRARALRWVEGEGRGVWPLLRGCVGVVSARRARWMLHRLGLVGDATLGSCGGLCDSGAVMHDGRGWRVVKGVGGACRS
jgi:hypothetical protein